MRSLTLTSNRPARTLSRRIAALSALAALALGSSACSSAVQEARGSANGKPQDGGVLAIASTTDISPATFFTNSTEVTNTVVGAVYDSLIDYDLDSLEPKPRLATSWKQSADGRTITLQLRDDVTFHSGREFTSKDVEFSIKTWADPKWSVQFLRTAQAITGFDTTDPHAITLTLKHPLSNLFDLLDTLPIIDSESLDQLAQGKAFVGTGAFVFKNWTPGAKVELEANENYWGGAPKLDGVKINIVPDGQAQVAQLRAGQVDLATGASFRDVASLEKDSKFSVHTFEGAENNVYVGSDLSVPALNNPKVRQGIAYALDRERIVKEVYQGAARPANLPWSATSPAFDAQQDSTYTYNPAKAKELIESAGPLPTIPLTFAAGNATYEAVAQIVQADLAAAGLKVELNPVEGTDFLAKLIGGKFQGLWVTLHNYAQFTPSTLAVSAFPFNADKNASHFDSAEYRAASKKAWELTNGTDAKAVQVYRDEINKVFLNDLFLSEIAVITTRIPTSNAVHDLNLSKRNELDLRTAYLSK